MDPEERLFTALSGGRPDRIPTFSLMIDPNISNQVLGRKPNGLLDFLSSDRGSRFVDRHARTLNRFIDPALFFFYNDAARVNHSLGFDGLWFGYQRIALRDHAQLEDAFGRLYDIVDDGHGNAYFMYRDGLLKTKED